MANETVRGWDAGTDTQEVDGSHLVKAREQAGHAAGQASQEDIDRLMVEEDVEVVDRTREIDARQFRKMLQEVS